ncbi:MAG: DUF3667 domain-containing protein [Candidatus Cloacimonetes bacterium]|nr:DUF3667 domain-containing protein [Candidatus Cloacimonadota bacterium]
MHCKNCQTEFSGNFCNNCGQPANIKRITFKYVISRGLDAFDFQNGLLFTIKELSIRPGKAVYKYITDKRFVYYNPLKYFLLLGAIFFFLNLKFSIFDFQSYIPQDFTEKQALFYEQFQSFFFRYFNLIILTVVPFFSLFSFLFFRKKNFNFSENMILNIFLFGHHSFIAIILVPFLLIYKLDTGILIQLYSIIGLLYHSWAYIQFFRVPVLVGIIKTFVIFY